jgi:hypothetical protein
LSGAAVAEELTAAVAVAVDQWSNSREGYSAQNHIK